MRVDSGLIFYRDRHVSLTEVSADLANGAIMRQTMSRLINGFVTRRRVERSGLRAFPTIINIEPTNYCNHRCKFCMTGLGTNFRPKGRLKLEVFKKALEHLSPGPVINLAGFGEPFLNEDLESFLDHAHQRGLSSRLRILSNFSVLSEARIRRLLDHPFNRLVISLDSMTRETFHEFRGCDDFNRVFENITILADEAKRRRGIPHEIAVQMVVNKKNVHEKETFIRAIKGLGLVPLIKTLNVHNSFADCVKIQEFEVDELSRYHKSGYTRKCEWVWGGMMVMWNGDVTICCQDATGMEVYGNVNEQSPIELLNVAEGRCEFRKRYFQDPGQIRVCQRCNLA